MFLRRVRQDGKRILPGVVVIPRHERQSPSRSVIETPHANVRVPEKIAFETAPRPIDDTVFYGVGRSPHRGAWPMVQTSPRVLAIQDITSHMSPPDLNAITPAIGHFLKQPLPGNHRGNQLPMVGRPNIRRPGGTTLGELSTVAPWQSVTSSLMQLTAK